MFLKDLKEWSRSREPSESASPSKRGGERPKTGRFWDLRPEYLLGKTHVFNGSEGAVKHSRSRSRGQTLESGKRRPNKAAGWRGCRATCWERVMFLLDLNERPRSWEPYERA